MYVSDSRVNGLVYIFKDNFKEQTITDLMKWSYNYFKFIDIPLLECAEYTIRFDEQSIKVVDIYSDILYSKNVESEFQTTRTLLNILRFLFKIKAIEKGFVNIHAGCIESRGEGTLLFGDKGAGKTTMVYNLMNNSKLKYFANDQVMVNLIEDKILAYSYPALIRIRDNMYGFSHEKNSKYILNESYDSICNCMSKTYLPVDIIPKKSISETSYIKIGNLIEYCQNNKLNDIKVDTGKVIDFSRLVLPIAESSPILIDKNIVANEIKNISEFIIYFANNIHFLFVESGINSINCFTDFVIKLIGSSKN